MKLYMSTGAMVLVLAIYVPMVFIALWAIWRRLSRSRVLRIAISAVLAVLAIAFPFWDVVMTSAQMARLCPTAGLAIRKTVEAEGYFGNFGSGQQAIKRGFSWFEMQHTPRRILIYSNEDGKVTEQIITPRTTEYQPKSRYEYHYDSGKQLEGALHIAVARSVTRDRVTGEILGEAVSYSAFPGWVDRSTVQLLGNFLWTCPENPGIHLDVVDRTIRPVTSR